MSPKRIRVFTSIYIYTNLYTYLLIYRSTYIYINKKNIYIYNLYLHKCTQLYISFLQQQETFSQNNCNANQFLS